MFKLNLDHRSKSLILRLFRIDGYKLFREVDLSELGGEEYMERMHDVGDRYMDWLERIMQSQRREIRSPNNKL